MKTAKFIKNGKGYTGDARLYELSEPVEYEGSTSQFVIVSAASVAFSGPETYIFLANSEGEVTNWGELPGSFRGGFDHEQALRSLGYEPT
jgi:hypothetical protein